GATGAGGSSGSGGAAGSTSGSGGAAGPIGGASGAAGSSGSGGAAGSNATGGAAGSNATGGAAGSSATGGAAGSGGTSGSGGAGGTAGNDGGAGKGGTGGAGGSTVDAGPATCSSYVTDTTYPCVMGIPAACGSNPVNCGATVCPANSSCGTGNTCPCNTGYLPVACDNGRKCSSSTNPCAGGEWGCYPKPDPGCTGNPSQTQGVCNCSDGKTYNLACGGTTTCDQHCRQGS
ncbi:MAG: hypothetical protein ABW133_21915, partial [Polyangiaceae bacterium]